MLITLFSDASICPDTGIAGWAAWVKCDRGSTRDDGALRRTTIDSAVAEAMALVNGLHVAHRDGLIAPGDSVLAQTDNNAVMTVLLGTARRGRRGRDKRETSFVELRTERRTLKAELEMASAAANDDATATLRRRAIETRLAEIKTELKDKNVRDEMQRAIAAERNLEIEEVARVYAALVERLGVTVRWRHCKGHKGLETKRSAVNTQCDARAKARMKEARREHQRLRAADATERPVEAARLPIAA